MKKIISSVNNWISVKLDFHLLGIGLLIASIGLLPLKAEFNKSGRTAFQVAKIGIGARQVALGEACAASINDVNSIFWNPAGVSGIGRIGSSINYNRWLADLNYFSFAAAFRIKRNHLISFGLSTLDYGDIDEALIPVTGGTSDTRTGETFSGSDNIISLTYAREYTDRLTIGISAKYMSEQLFDYTVDLWAFDVGTFYKIGFKDLRIAMSAQNFKIGSVKWLEESDRDDGYDIPLVYRIGVAMNVIDGSDGFINLGATHRLQYAFDAISSNDYGERYHMGLEYWYKEFIAIRGGYKHNYQDGNLSLGLGIKLDKFNLDYAFTAYEYLNSPQRISIVFTF
ncbi:MAG: PorV/PorQ family protein [Candidatus Marinimicrobia bacterium]|nr:PorV/PorQ family protein [Candidatus Neomarinimicrobiota bacterium]